MMLPFDGLYWTFNILKQHAAEQLLSTTTFCTVALLFNALQQNGDTMSFLVYMTAPTPEEARSIGKKLVSENLAACINIFPNVESIFTWEDEVQSAHEVVFIAKTSEAKVTALTKRVRELHSYDVPCIISIPITGGNPEFLSWIEHETR